MDRLIVPAKDVVGVINNTLNLVDPRLINHGVRVAELVYHTLEKMGGFSQKQTRDLCLLALIHDIGAYKTDEIDRLVHFESVRVWQHSIYGYLFINKIKPLAQLAPVVLFHHAYLGHLKHLDKAYHDLAQIFHVADRVEIAFRTRGHIDNDTFRRGFASQRDVRISGTIIDLFEAVLFDGGEFNPAVLGEGDTEAELCQGIFEETSFADEELRGFAYLLAHSIDFRSPQTMTHTVGVAEVAQVMADLLDMDDTTKRQILFASLVHDLGKQGIPLAILEADRGLDRHEMDIMRTHVRLSEEVLTGHMDPEIIRIAVRHHEKLDGTGYHYGISEAELTQPERLMAVADVLSALLGRRTYKEPFSKEKAVAILKGMSDRKHLDPDIVGVAAENMDVIMGAMNRVTEETIVLYDGIRNDYARYLDMFEGRRSAEGVVVSGD